MTVINGNILETVEIWYKMEAQAGDVADQSGWELIRPVFLATIMCELQYVHIHPHKQPKLAAIIQSRRLTLFGHIMRVDVNADAKRILLASPPADWRRQPGRPSITWLSTIQQDLKQRHLTLPEAADSAQNRRLWRTMSTYGATQS